MKLTQYPIDGLNYTNEAGENLYRVMSGDSIHLDIIVKSDIIIVVERLNVMHHSYEWTDLTKALYELKLIDSKVAINCTTKIELISFNKDIREYKSMLPKWYY